MSTKQETDIQGVLRAMATEKLGRKAKSFWKLRNMANYELFYGPCELPISAQFPMAEKAVDLLIRSWPEIENNAMYYDADYGDISTALPAGFEDDEGYWVEPYFENIYEVENPLREIVGYEFFDNFIR